MLAVNPPSVASAERTFSCMKRLKTWLRTTTGQNKLQGLASMALNRNGLPNIDQIINKFAESIDVIDATRVDNFLRIRALMWQGSLPTPVNWMLPKGYWKFFLFKFKKRQFFYAAVFKSKKFMINLPTMEFNSSKHDIDTISSQI